MTYHIQIANWAPITAEYPDASYDESTTPARPSKASDS